MMTRGQSPILYDMSLPPDDFRADVLHGLAAEQKELPCKYFYDQAGAQLFERICSLPEYYLTRTELAILRRYRGEMAELLGERCLLIEFGSGSITKTRMLLDHLAKPSAYVPVDISREQLLSAACLLARDYPGLEVCPVCADFTRPLVLPANGAGPCRRAVYFPGSTIGNFIPDRARLLLNQAARLCGPGGAMLLGADLKKDPRLLHAAYNDSQGVTAAFNLNLLVRINRELKADFQVENFWHHAFYNPCPGRVEMHLVSRLKQSVEVAGREFSFAEGESICTEYSHKYSIDDVASLAQTAGFELQEFWSDELKYFGVFYLTVPFARDEAA